VFRYRECLLARCGDCRCSGREATRSLSSWSSFYNFVIVTDAEIAALWPLACAHAGYRPGDDAVLYLVPGDAAQGNSALHVEPGSEVAATREWSLTSSQVADANSVAQRNKHRVFVRAFTEPFVALGRLRHELEHARQYDRSASVYLFSSFVQDAISHEFELTEPETWTGSGTVYNLLPSEEDANRAAAQANLGHFGPPTAEQLAGFDSVLVRDDGGVEPDLLGRRLLVMAALFPDGFYWVAGERGESRDELLGRLGPEARSAWEKLAADPEIAAAGAAALALAPSEAEVNSAPMPAAAWGAVAEKIKDGRIRAEQLLATDLPDLRLS
jgi:hypothetical protein